MFMQVIDVANHLMSKLAPWRDDREEIAMEASCNFMTKIRDGVNGGPGRPGKNEVKKEFNPEHLATCVRFDVVAILYSNRQKFEDSILSLDEYYENNGEQSNEI